MRLLGIEFAEFWKTPTERRLQTLSVLIFCNTFLLHGIGALWLLYYCFFHTTYLWPLTCLYLAWYVWDLDTCNKGGRRSNWFRNSGISHYYSNYFPVKLVKTAEIDASKGNYLFGSHPHGLLSFGAVAAFGLEGAKWSQIFPELKPTLCTLQIFHQIPGWREFGQLTGACAATSQSLDYLLGNGPQKNGRAVVLVVGGAREVFCQDQNKIDLVMLKRKGFIKKALKHGSDLVPTFSFGEAFLYNAMWPNPKGSWTRTIQEYVVSKTRWPIPFFIGRGVFQYSFGLLPQRHPITVVVGEPIPTTKVDEPSQEEIDALHAKYLKALRALYDQYNPLYGDPKVELGFI